MLEAQSNGRWFTRDWASDVLHLYPPTIFLWLREWKKEGLIEAHNEQDENVKRQKKKPPRK